MTSFYINWVKPYLFVYLVFSIIFASIIELTIPPMHQIGSAEVSVNSGIGIPQNTIVYAHRGDVLSFNRTIYSNSRVTVEIRRTFFGPVSVEVPETIKELAVGNNEIFNDIQVPDILSPGTYKYSIQVFYQELPFFNLSINLPGFTIVILPDGVMK